MYSVLIPESCIYTTRDYDATITPWSDYVVRVAFLCYDDYSCYCSRWADIILSKV